jgi:hypothetical protein
MLAHPQLYVPLAGDYGPSFDRGGTAVPARVSHWEMHPGAWLVVLIFLAYLGFKVAR